MSAAKAWPLKRPGRDGFVGPHMASSLVDAVTDRIGSMGADTLIRSARLQRSPNPDEPIRETRAAALHRTMRDQWAEDADGISRVGGRWAGQVMLDRQLPQRAQALLKSAPWTISAWMLSRAMTQHSWIFAGSGAFSVTDEMRFEIRGNPFIKGETSSRPLCAFHATMFETIYTALVDPRLVCEETTCEAAGDDACRFSFGLEPPQPA